MSRFVTKTDKGYIEEIESMEVCKHRINYTCCNEKILSWFCCNKNCPYYEKEDGVINE